MTAARLRVCAAMIAHCVALPLAAQTFSLFPYPQARTTLGARFLHILPNKEGTPFTDGALDLTVNAPVGERVNVMVSASWTHDEPSPNVGRTLAGNVFVGAQISADSTRRTVATVGIYIPAASTPTPPLALWVNRYEFQRYVGGYTTAYANAAGRLLAKGDVALLGEVGTTCFVAKNRGDTSAVFLHYGLGTIVGNAGVRFTFEYAGLLNFAESFAGVPDRILHFVTVGATLMGSRVRPAVSIQLPLNQILRAETDGALGLACVVVL